MLYLSIIFGIAVIIKTAYQETHSVDAVFYNIEQILLAGSLVGLCSYEVTMTLLAYFLPAFWRFSL